MRKIGLIFLIGIVLLGCNNKKPEHDKKGKFGIAKILTINTPSQGQCLEFAMCIPNHQMKNEARPYFTKEYLAAWDAIWTMPDYGDYAGYLPNKEWIYYFVTGNGGADHLQAHIENISKANNNLIISFYYTNDYDYYSNEEPERHTINLVYRGNQWLIDDYDNTKARMTEWVKNEIDNFIHSEDWKQIFEEYESLYQYEHDMQMYIDYHHVTVSRK